MQKASFRIIYMSDKLDKCQNSKRKIEKYIHKQTKKTHKNKLKKYINKYKKIKKIYKYTYIHIYKIKKLIIITKNLKIYKQQKSKQIHYNKKILLYTIIIFCACVSISAMQVGILNIQKQNFS